MNKWREKILIGKNEQHEVWYVYENAGTMKIYSLLFTFSSIVVCVRDNKVTKDRSSEKDQKSLASF